MNQIGWTNNNEYQCQCSPGNLESWQANTGNNCSGGKNKICEAVYLLSFYLCAGCLDVDECADNYFSTEYCGANTECTNTIGSFSCECQLGHEAWVPGQGCCVTDMESSCASEPEGTCQLSADQGILNSHSLDQSLYSNGVNSHWHIRVPDGKIIELIFEIFDVRLTLFTMDPEIFSFSKTESGYDYLTLEWGPCSTGSYDEKLEGLLDTPVRKRLFISFLCHKLLNKAQALSELCKDGSLPCLTYYFQFTRTGSGNSVRLRFYTDGSVTRR